MATDVAEDANVPRATEVQVERGRRDPGEHIRTPEHLTLSLYLGPPLTLEQKADGDWRGVSVRGDLKIMVPEQPRIFRHVRDAEFAIISFVTRPRNGDSDSDYAQTVHSLRPRFLCRDPAISQFAGALVRAASEPLYRMTREAAAARLLQLLRATEGVPETPLRRGLPKLALERVLEFLHAHLSDDVSVIDLAEIAGLRPSQFSTLFRNSTGQPPHRYMLSLRVERAVQLLEHGAHPTAVAQQVGFYDQSHLTRHMKRIIGTTPGAIARNGAIVGPEDLGIVSRSRV